MTGATVLVRKGLFGGAMAAALAFGAATALKAEPAHPCGPPTNGYCYSASRCNSDCQAKGALAGGCVEVCCWCIWPE